MPEALVQAVGPPLVSGERDAWGIEVGRMSGLVELPAGIVGSAYRLAA
jgi:hypothetical protein